MKNSGIIKTVTATVASLCLIVAIIILSVRIVCFDRNIYAREYEKSHTAWFMDTTDEELMKATEALLLYIQGDRDSIMVDIEMDGEQVSFYNEREAQHMIDVKVLYENAMAVMYIGFAAFAVLTAVLLALYKGGALKNIINGFFIANIIAVVIIGILAAFLLIDFDTFWTSFHHIFFTNDLWQMNIFTDRMIQLFSGGDFFFSVCVGVVIWSVGIDIILLIAAFITKAVLKKKIAN